MKILIMRHTQALTKEQSEAAYDADRRLSTLGKKHAKEISSYLLGLDIQPNPILTSPFIRCHETAEIIASNLPYDVNVKALSILAPGSGLDDLLRAIINHGENNDDWTLCILHQPDVSFILGTLICTDSNFTVPVKNGDIYALDVQIKHGRRDAFLIFSYSIFNDRRLNA
jgi:phosphohistidine phosphatase